MSTFASRVFVALGEFNGRLTTFAGKVQATPASPKLPRKALDELLEIAERARKASDAIAQSLTLIGVTALDIVDMQFRLKLETANLASALRQFEEAIEKQHFIREAFDDELLGLRDAAQLIAAAVFPSAVAGLLDVNEKLWEFQRIESGRYDQIFADVVRRNSITPTQQVEIQKIADEVKAAFEEVNTLLNDLAEARMSDAAALRKRLARAPERLTDALATAETRMKSAGKTFEDFDSVIKNSKKIAGDVAKLLRKLTIPVFPAHAKLGPCCNYIDQPLYEGLGGVQAFALLNILARLEATAAMTRPLLANRNVRVVQVFPDRIYFEADNSIIDDLAKDTASFTPAPAALHKFKDGSFKQTTFKHGNVQVSYAARANGRVIIDADIDLHRGAISHLFGEVLINHLTGGTTDQYEVRKILDGQKVASIGGFELLTATA